MYHHQHFDLSKHLGVPQNIEVAYQVNSKAKKRLRNTALKLSRVIDKKNPYFAEDKNFKVNLKVRLASLRLR